MPVRKGNRSKRKLANRARTKRVVAKGKRRLGIRRKRRAKRSPR